MTIDIETLGYSELIQGCEEVLPSAEFVKKLEKGQPLTIKAGFDPTAPDIHLGHVVLLNKLRQFQQWGHQVVFLIGDFTARIGDPTGRNALRAPLSEAQIHDNAATYQNQVFKLLDPEKTRVVFNSSWLSALSATSFIELASTYTVARMLEREDFHQRYTQGTPISIHEFLYPLIQGYDSYILKADVECGGTDQKFNLLMGRELQRHYGQDPQIIMMTPIIEGLDGVKKMSKSLNNYVGVNEAPDQMFGKLMSISDTLMWRYMDLLSLQSRTDLLAVKKAVKEGLNPRDVKLNFAKEMVSCFHDATQAQAAEYAFIERFQQRHIPEDLPLQTLHMDIDPLIAQVLKQAGLVQGTSEGMRLIKQGAVKINGEKITDCGLILTQNESHIIQVGKQRLAKLQVIKK